MQWIKEVGEGEMFPTGYGIAWRRWDRNMTAAMPVPLNIIAGALRRFYLWLATFWRTPTDLERMQILAHIEGYQKARDDVRRTHVSKYEATQRAAYSYKKGYAEGRQIAFIEIEAQIGKR